MKRAGWASEQTKTNQVCSEVTEILAVGCYCGGKKNPRCFVRYEDIASCI